jgi:hypothetical protein
MFLLNAKMKILLFVIFLFSFPWNSLADDHESFLQCLVIHSNDSKSFSKLIYTPTNSSFESLLNSTIKNGRFLESAEPQVIVTPTEVNHIRSTIKCARNHGLEIRIRSGGHDAEGLSYVSELSFIILDMRNLNSVEIDVESNTAWVQSGATLGEVYYKIVSLNKNLAFPAGSCPTVGTGGHFSGGGYGLLFRKYGLAADHVVDAQFIDVNGRIHDRESMGEDLFWAIRGGGGNSFGVVLSWKINLVSVPSTVTISSVQMTNLEQNVTKLARRWQEVTPNFPDEIYMEARFKIVNSSDQDGNKTIQATFLAMFLGNTESFLGLMQERFPELGIVKDDCKEVTWVESTFQFYASINGVFNTNFSLDLLISTPPSTTISASKTKSDYVKKPMPEIAWEGIWKFMYETEGQDALVSMVAYGGKMSRISESATPFPHRAGNICELQHLLSWVDGETANRKHINWSRRLHKFLTPYVSKNPREAYVNYRDLDLGTNNVEGKTSYEKARIWGRKYFNNNFDRLVHVKTLIDPTNFFKNEQSIPAL